MAESPTSLTSTEAAPAPSSPRVAALDVLRGIAILGTLGTNVWIVTHPEGLVGYLQGTGEPTGARWWLEQVLQQLVQGKFLGLLTIMFGIGLALQQRSAVRAGRAWPGSYPWRAALLLLDGLVNFVLVAEFDVLMGYAVTGGVVAYLLATGERAQRRWLLAATAVHLALLTAVALVLAWAAQQPTTPQSSSPPKPLDPNPYADGSFWDLVLFRLDHAMVFRLESVLIFPMSVALFLLGARLFRAGLFEPSGQRLRRRLLILGFGIAAPVDLALGLWHHDLVLVTRYGTAPFVSLGILALVAQFYVGRRQVGAVGRRFAEIGRMALSCYILQNLVAGALCYGWGFGLADRVAPADRVTFTLAIYLVVCAIMLVFAHLWLRRFARGPVEWLWHTSYRALARDRA